MEPETLTTKRKLERRMGMSLRESSFPSVLRDLLREAARGICDEVPVDLSWARDFERDVLEAALRIPYGETRSYGWLAREARRPLAVRAAASVIARDPLWFIVPAHRIIHADGTLGSFGGGAAGLARKRRLLEREGVKLATFENAKRKRSSRPARTHRR